MQLQRRPSGLPDWLYVAIVAVPESFTTILATIGGLVGVLAPTGGLARSSQPRQDDRPPVE